MRRMVYEAISRRGVFSVGVIRMKKWVLCSVMAGVLSAASASAMTIPVYESRVGDAPLVEKISDQDDVYLRPKIVAEQIRPYVPGQYVVCGTDGFGRSESREALRRHFEIDAESVAYTTLVALSKEGQFDAKKLPQVLKDLGIDSEKVDPATA